MNEKQYQPVTNGTGTRKRYTKGLKAMIASERRAGAKIQDLARKYGVSTFSVLKWSGDGRKFRTKTGLTASTTEAHHTDALRYVTNGTSTTSPVYSGLEHEKSPIMKSYSSLDNDLIVRVLKTDQRTAACIYNLLCASLVK